MNANPYKEGDKVCLKKDGLIYTVCEIYDDEHLSLGLYDYPDCEQDFVTHINEIKGV